MIIPLREGEGERERLEGGGGERRGEKKRKNNLKDFFFACLLACLSAFK